MLRTWAEAACHQIMTADRDKEANIERCPDTQKGKYRQTDNDGQTRPHPASKSLFSPLGSVRSLTAEAGKTQLQTPAPLPSGP